MLKSATNKPTLLTDGGKATPPAPEAPTQQTTQSAQTTTASSSQTKGSSNTSANLTEENANTNVEGNTSALYGNREKMKAVLNSVIKTSFKSSSNNNESEIIDIINDYPWIADNVINSNRKVQSYDFNSNIAGSGNISMASYAEYSNIPYCYVIERKVSLGSTVASIFSLLNTFNDVLSGARSNANAIADLLGVENNIQNPDTAKTKEPQVQENPGDTQEEIEQKDDSEVIMTEHNDFINGNNSVTKSIKKWIEKWLPGVAKIFKTNNLNDELLNPYRFMYFTTPTQKRFVFPYAQEEISIKNQWGSNQNKLHERLESMIKMAKGIVSSMASIDFFAANMLNAMKTGEANTTFVQEQIKYYNYPNTGDKVKVKFTLYNTTKKNVWKDNFKFIYLFTIRSLPFRLETLTFIPPCLYDIIIPGVKRLPVCSLSEMKIKPIGMERTLKMENFLKHIGTGAPDEIIVNVPEAWEVDMTFESLLAPSANFMLLNYIGSIGIDAAITTSPEEKSDTPNAKTASNTSENK